jgi:hypothetical protein
MTGIMSLWLPILLSSVAVFLASFLVHMVLPWHKGDYRRLPDEDAFRNAVGPMAIPPGDYMVPRPMGRDEMRSEAFLDKVKMGPNVVMTVLPSRAFSIAQNLVQWFIYLVAVAIMSAYIASRALTTNAEYWEIVRFVGTTAWIGFSVALWQMSIWYHRSWGTTLRQTIDGLIYAFITGFIFAWCWPG